MQAQVLDSLDAYSAALDAAWEALEQAIVSMKQLNDLMYAGEALVMRAPAADVSLLREKARELNGEMACYYDSKEPSNLPPILPGEVLYQQMLRDACLR